jgi:hypothetical protein
MIENIVDAIHENINTIIVVVNEVFIKSITH